MAKSRIRRILVWLECLPPAAYTSVGFLVGEPWTHLKCTVSRTIEPAFQAFAEIQGEYYKAAAPLTIAEFKATEATEIINSANS